MKKRIFSVISVVMLIVMTLPATSPPPVVAQPSGWPTIWTGLASDDNEHCETFRNVADMDGDGYALYYDVDSQYIYLRMETVTAPGWPSTGSQGAARYKWWFSTAGAAAYVSGTSVYNAEFLLILEDRTDTSNVDGSRDQLGELTLMDDLANIGFAKRWNKGDSGAYLTGTPDNGGSSSLWKRAVGNGTAGTGGPQGVMGADIGYRIDNGFVDMYVSRAALGNASSLCLIWATDNQNPNLDQAPNCDRPTGANCIMLGEDFGDAPAPYPTLMANDGARHAVGDIYLGATIDAELDGQPNSTATGDDNSDLDDEDGVVFTTALVKSQSADVTVTASDAGYLDAWVDFNDDGDWADGDEQIFAGRSLSAGANYLNFSVPVSATQTDQAFARFRFSSAGGLSYDGPAADGEVEDYQVAVEDRLILTITADSDSKVYDGTPLTNSGYSITAGALAAGHSLDSVVVTGSQTDVGSSDNVPSDAVIMDNGTNVTAKHDITYVNGTLTVTRRPPPPPRGGGGGCPVGCARYFTVDWDEKITRTCLPDNDRLAEDMLCPDPDGKHNLFLEQGTLAPEVDGERHYLIIIRELEEEDTPPVPDNTMAVAAFNITPAGAVFEEEIILTLGIDLLPDDAVDADIFYYDEAHGVWVPLDGDPVDPNGVAELSLSAGVNHFTVFAVLVDLAPPAPPASFVASDLSIELSVEKIWSAITFVTKTGENVTITAKVENDGGQAGTYTVELKINGEIVDSETVTLDAGQSQYVSFDRSDMGYGQYEVEVAGLSDTFTTFRTITWWLIIILIAAIGLITWGAVWARRRRRARQQA